MSVHYSYANPMRPVTWRWHRAREIAAGTGLATSQSRDGPDGYHWIKRAVHFLQQDAAATTERRQALLAENCPDIFWAYHMWRNDMSNLSRYTLEASLLAGCDNIDVAYLACTTKEIVDAFEALFFNVKGRLQHKMYIVNCVFGPAICGGLVGRQFDTLWKMYGYFLGIHALTAIITGFSDISPPEDPSNVSATFGQDIKATMAMKTALAAKTLNINDRNQLRVLETWAKFTEIERLAGGAAEGESQILSALQSVAQTLGRHTVLAGPMGDAGLQNDRVADIERSGAELSYEELVNVASGYSLAHTPEIKKLTFESASGAPV